MNRFTLSVLFSSVVLTGCQLSPVDEELENAANPDTHSPQIFEEQTAVIDAPPVLIEEEIIEVVELPPEPIVYDDVWMRIQSQLSLRIPDDKRVNSQRNWYAKHGSYMKRVSKRADPYLYLIVERIEARNMPIELALLPIVESAFDPFAYSHGRASGMWQFVPGTGKRFGLEQNWWYDGRRDIVASTDAALDYLAYLHKRFNGDWLHALAAYNSGEGRVGKAIRKNKRNGKPTDFWNLDLPRETEAYVPKLLALAELLAEPEKYSVDWHPIANQPQLRSVEVGSQIDLAYAADLADMSVRQLHAFNPGYNRWATAPDGPHRILLPLENAEKFEVAISDTTATERLNWVRYKVKSGDSLIVIAKKYNTTVDVIRQVNNVKNNMIRAGDYMLIPVAAKSMDEYSLAKDQRIAATKSKKRSDRSLSYEVKSGDTLWDISRLYKVDIKQLAKWNGMAPRDPLRIKQKLVIWLDDDTSTSAHSAVMRNITYKVRNGDSMARIASKFNIRIADIEKWNQLNRKKYLQPGQKLKLYVDVTKT